MLKKQNIKSEIKERRRYTRVKKSLTVVRCPLKYLFDSDSLSRDISEDGICLFTDYKMQIGETIELNIYLPECREPVATVGKVVRRNETNDLKFPYLLGIQFTEIDPDAKEKILNHIRFYMLENK